MSLSNRVVTDVSEQPLNNQPPPDYEELVDEPLDSSAPPAFSWEDQRRGLDYLSYEEVVKWWNDLMPNQRDQIKAAACGLSQENFAQLRKDYQDCYPKEYYPSKVYAENELSSCDYFLMYYFREQMSKYNWFRDDLYQTLQLDPPPYQAQAPNDSAAAQPQLSPPTYGEAMNWWKGLPPQERRGIESRPIEIQQIRVVRRVYLPYYRSYSPCFNVFSNNLTPLDYYLMARYSPRFGGYPFWSLEDCAFYSRLGATVELTSIAVQGVVHVVTASYNILASGVKVTGHFLATVGNNVSSSSSTSSSSAPSSSSSSSSNEDSAGAILLGFAVIVGCIFAAFAAFIGATYAGIKALSSLANLARGRKLGASLWRLACIAGGAYLGVTQGAILGALVGSMIPGIGTAAGVILGAVFGSGIMVGIGAILGKYSAQFIAWCVTGFTNPEKWDIASEIELAMQEHHVPGNTQNIQSMLQDVRQQKNEYPGFWDACVGYIKGAFPGTDENNKKHQYNKFLEAVQMGNKDPGKQRIRIDQNTCMMWNPQARRIDKTESPLLQPQGLNM